MAARTLNVPQEKTVRYLCYFLGIYDILALSGIFDYMGFHVVALVHRALNLAVMIAIAFFLQPARDKDKARIPWYDYVLVLMAVIPCGYAAVFSDTLLSVQAGDLDPTIIDKVMAASLIVSIIESTRRAAGTAMVVVALFFFSTLFFGKYYPGFLNTRPVSYEYIVRSFFCSVESTSIFGTIAEISAGILVSFMLFGGFLAVSGAGDFFIKMGLSLAGRYRGGPAKVAVIASGLMGMISGSGVANVATVGTMTIPLMKKVGYSRNFSGAVEAVASNGGQIMPPVMGLVAFFMAQILNVPYWSICVAGAIPAVLYYTSLYFMIDLEAAKNNLSGMSDDQVPSFWATLKDGWYFFLPIVVLVILIAGRTLSVEKSCMITIATMIPISYIGGKKRGLNFERILQSIRGGVISMAIIIGAVMGSGIIISSINITGVGLAFSRIVLSLAGDSTFMLLALAALSSFILGMGMSSLPCYIILALLVGPPLVRAGLDPMGAHLFFFWWAILSFITPPVAISAVAAAAIAGGDYMKTGWNACRIGIVAYIVPFFFVYNPAILMKGPVPLIIVALITGMIGCYFLASGMIGFTFRRNHPIEIILFLACGLTVMVPKWEIAVPGLLVGLALVSMQYVQVKRLNSTSVSALALSMEK